MTNERDVVVQKLQEIEIEKEELTGKYEKKKTYIKKLEDLLLKKEDKI